MEGKTCSWLASDEPGAQELGTRALGDETPTRHEAHRMCRHGPSTSGASDSGMLGSWDASRSLPSSTGC
jgi:hypothetical protein